MIFDYPDPRPHRRHHPGGYRRYESYRPWLRDDFCFRCVYCLKRETWGTTTGEFDLDHFSPQSVSTNRTLDYLNLVYSCHRCNLVKSGHSIDDPLVYLTNRTVVSHLDGAITGTDPETRKLILQLDLDSPVMRKWRHQWIRIVRLARDHDEELLEQLTRFPDNLPNLARRPPTNDAPDGIPRSWHARRERGELPRSY
ncbi:MAG: HNH endonuclease [Rhodopirellula sp. JB055]|uniref:HNH endonuclease n=1 Tax=Rhodopirellula sp. JB055 TaxID=3342846 RepID=UPI00370B80DD